MLCFFEDPFLEVDEIECMGVVYLLSLEPLDEEGKVIIDLLPVKNTVDHVAAEKTHFDLVASVGVDFCVFMD